MRGQQARSQDRAAGHVRRAACLASRRGERGHLLLVLMVGITVMLIMITVAAQSWTFRMKREMEAEVIFRGEQYVMGIELWRQKTGGFPVGDLEVLVKKGPDLTRVMRKLYKNPFDKEGRWQYLLLHPSGNGFINPCANAGPEAFAAMGGIPGQIPVQGLSMNAPAMSGGSMVQPPANVPGTRKSRFNRGGGNNPFGDLSAMEPEQFEQTIKGMNLAIVGVVNCTQEASIKMYQGQSWLSNWAFTPLAQGEFGGQAPGGHLAGGKVNIKSGVGMSGAMAYTERNADLLSGHGGGLVTRGNNVSKPNSRSQSGQARVPDFLRGDDDEEEEDQRYDYQWRRNDPDSGDDQAYDVDEDEAGDEDDEGEDEDWRLRRWRRQPGDEQPPAEPPAGEGEGEGGDEDDDGDDDGEDGDEEGDGDDGDDEEGDEGEDEDDDGGDDDEDDGDDDEEDDDN